MPARARQIVRTGAVLAVTALTTTSLVLGAAEATTSDPDEGETPLAEESGGEPDLVSFGIAPAGAERPDERPYLQIGAPAGSVIYEHVALINQDDQPVELHVYSGDVINADNGLAVLPRATESVDAGAWVDFGGLETVVVPPQTPENGYGYAIVPFTVSIPADAEPGDHSAGIVASLVTVGQGGENAPSIELEQRVAARVYISVEGEARGGLEVVDVDASYVAGALVGPGSVEVGYTVRNTGNVRIAVEPAVSVGGPFGLLQTTVDGERIDELLPGGEVRLATTVDAVWPLVRETVTVAATGVAAPGGLEPAVGTVTASATVWAIPWVWLAILLLLAALVTVGVRRRRTRPQGRRVAPRGRGKAPDGAPAPSTRPAETTPVGVGPAGGRRS